jgi:hypothetical protein
MAVVDRPLNLSERGGGKGKTGLNRNSIVKSKRKEKEDNV